MSEAKGPLGIPKRWMVRAEPPTRPGFKYQPTFFWSKRKAEEWVRRLRRDGCFVQGVERASDA